MPVCWLSVVFFGGLLHHVPLSLSQFQLFSQASFDLQDSSVPVMQEVQLYSLSHCATRCYHNEHEGEKGEKDERLKGQNEGCRMKV